MEAMNIASFSTHASFEGHAVMARLQAPPADVASFVFALPSRKLMAEIAAEVLGQYPTIFIAHIMGRTMNRDVCAARAHIWWQVRHERPDLSIAAIAKKFDRDRVSIRNGIKNHEKRLNAAKRGKR